MELRDRRIAEIIDLICEIAGGNLSRRGLPSDQDDELDAVTTGLNMLADELQATMVSRDYLDAIIDSAAVALFVVSGEGRIIAANSYSTELFGGPSESLQGRKVETLFADTPTALREDFIEKLKAGKLRDTEVTCVTPDGEARPVMLSATGLRASEGYGVGVLCSAHDLRPLRNAQDRLRRSEATFRTLVDAAPDGIVLVDDDGRILQANPAFSRMIGTKQAGAAVGQKLDELIGPIPEGNEATEPQPVSPAAASLMPRAHNILLPDQTTRFVEKHAARVIDDFGAEHASVVVVHDVTVQRRAVDELANAVNDLERFAYAVAHDLKAPLNALVSLSTWLAEDLEPVLTDQTRQYLDLLRSRTERMTKFVDAILRYSRVGREAEPPVEIDIAELVEQVLTWLDLGDELTVEFANKMPVVLGVRVQLEQVFANLLNNAHRHHDNRPARVTIRAREVTGFHEFLVSDDGPGIAEPFRDRVFEFFQTLRPRDETENVGVGLAIAKRIIDSQGGHIRVEPNKGRGAIFAFTWPKEPPRRFEEPRPG